MIENKMKIHFLASHICDAGRETVKQILNVCKAKRMVFNIRLYQVVLQIARWLFFYFYKFKNIVKIWYTVRDKIKNRAIRKRLKIVVSATLIKTLYGILYENSYNLKCRHTIAPIVCRSLLYVILDHCTTYWCVVWTFFWTIVLKLIQLFIQ
jgi:hypothetical protein